MKLSVNQLSYRYPESERIIFHDVSFSIDNGELLSILGANGAGKSTLLNCMSGLFSPASGSVSIDGVNIAAMSRRQLARQIAYVPQNHTPIYDFSVLEFTVMGRTPYINTFSSPGTADYKKAEEALERMGIARLKDKYYTRISGGERQMVMIARAICQEPQFIFLDEPTSHLDYGNQIKTVRLVQELSKQGFGIIMTTHNPDQVLYSGGKVALLDKTGALQFGTPEEILKEETLSALYREPVSVFYSKEMDRIVCLSGKHETKKEEKKMMGPKIVMENCIGCGECMKACAMKHFGTEDTSLAMIQVSETADGKREFIACDLCGLCAEACPVNAIVPDPRGVLVVDRDACVSCGSCIDACPKHLIRMTDQGAVKCMRCAACVMACPNGVFQPPDEP